MARGILNIIMKIAILIFLVTAKIFEGLSMAFEWLFTTLKEKIE